MGFTLGHDALCLTAEEENGSRSNVVTNSLGNDLSAGFCASFLLSDGRVATKLNSIVYLFNPKTFFE